MACLAVAFCSSTGVLVRLWMDDRIAISPETIEVPTIDQKLLARFSVSNPTDSTRYGVWIKISSSPGTPTNSSLSMDGSSQGNKFLLEADGCNIPKGDYIYTILAYDSDDVLAEWVYISTLRPKEILPFSMAIDNPPDASGDLRPLSMHFEVMASGDQSLPFQWDPTSISLPFVTPTNLRVTQLPSFVGHGWVPNPDCLTNGEQGP